MRVLVVQNYPNTGLGQVGTALGEAGADVDMRRAYEGEALPTDADRHAALIVLGGGQNALADDTHAYFPNLLGLIRDFAERGRPILGICLGAQLMARAFGGENRIGAAREFSWQKVSLTEDGRADPVLGGLPENYAPFQWHDDTFSLPPGAVRLARSEAVETQAFRIGRACYAVQFHFEANRPMLAEWNAAFADEIAPRHPDWPERYERESASLGPAADREGLALARRWVALI